MEKYLLLCLLGMSCLSGSVNAKIDLQSPEHSPDFTLFSDDNSQFSMGFSFSDKKLPHSASGMERFNTYKNLKKRLDHESSDESDDSFPGFPDLLHDELDSMMLEFQFRF